MPKIDVYARRGSFPDPHRLARGRAAAVMRWEQVPDQPLAAINPAALIHDMDAVARESGYLRVQERRKRRLAGRVAVAEVPGAT
jgi:hypothetical protein